MLMWDWCRFPRTKCACPESTSNYERLDERILEFHLLLPEDKDLTNEKEEELQFYNDDGSFQSVVVERNLCTSDLCQLLALKNRVAKSVNWSVVEHWVDLGLERLLEDHEYVLSAHRDVQNYSRHADVRFVFRKDYRKYEFFHHPHQFFPPDMIDLDSYEELNGINVNHSASLQNLVTQEGKCPIIFSQVWLQDPQKQTWGKAFLLLRDRKLYLSYKVQVLAKFLRTVKSKESSVSELIILKVDAIDINRLGVFLIITIHQFILTVNILFIRAEHIETKVKVTPLTHVTPL
ncbi:growth factor receptor-bound protein 10-like isoform X3 [Photinus pyralis]|uniref:growth factor receptor-bound protein 10-like isoform X3 n=1 Tax=Photinus pyralis TaxID=7054 RepID=UPI001266FC3E|nr:growth factor receptor-bound protein 10-like isoform X3 [Photinus pyralis]